MAGNGNGTEGGSGLRVIAGIVLIVMGMASAVPFSLLGTSVLLVDSDEMAPLAEIVYIAGDQTEWHGVKQPMGTSLYGVARQVTHVAVYIASEKGATVLVHFGGNPRWGLAGSIVDVEAGFEGWVIFDLGIGYPIEEGVEHFVRIRIKTLVATLGQRATVWEGTTPYAGNALGCPLFVGGPNEPPCEEDLGGPMAVKVYGEPGDFDPPEASFTYGVDELEVSFNDASMGDNLYIWEWDFGDGSTAAGINESDPVHTYASAGSYNVTMKVCGRMSAGSASLICDVAGATVSVATLPGADGDGDGNGGSSTTDEEEDVPKHEQRPLLPSFLSAVLIALGSVLLLWPYLSDQEGALGVVVPIVAFALIFLAALWILGGGFMDMFFTRVG